MFSSLGQGTRDSAAVVNPFAAVPSLGESNAFSSNYAADSKNNNRTTILNPFQVNQSGGTGFRAPFSAGTSDNETNSQPSASYNLKDPLAKKVYERLHQDGIQPPSWPSQPGNPKNKQAMAKFREQYEAYRKRVRTSLTKAGLIDDPDKRKALSDAIEFKGICEDMCPEFEKITRITELDVVSAEKDSRMTFANTSKMVKKLARSAAGQEAPLPMDVRSISALRRSLDYLLDDVLQNDGNLPVVHGFLWDRTRAIRRDFSFFSSLTPEEIKTQVYVLENIARFHVTSLHLLSKEGQAPEDFVEQQELEQLGKALLSLRDVYDDCGLQGIMCENEPQFRAYYLLFHARDPSILETLQRQWKPYLWRDSDDVRTAVSLVEALQDTREFHGPLKEGPSLAASGACQAYFRIVRDPKVSYTMACFAECHFPQLRRSILQKVKRALARPKDPARDVTAAALNSFLHFDTVQQAIEFAELHNFEFVPDPSNPSNLEQQCVVLDARQHLPHRRLQHQFSQKLVERKRGNRPLPEVIHHTLLEDPNASTLVNGSVSEGSLFVQDDEVQQSPPAFGGGGFSTNPMSTMTNSAPSPFGTLPGNEARKSNTASKSTGFITQPSTNPFSNPFATISDKPASSTFNFTAKTAPSPFSTAKNNDMSSPNMPGDVAQSKPNPFAPSSQMSDHKAVTGDNVPKTSPAAPVSFPAFSGGQKSNSSASSFPSSGAAGRAEPASGVKETSASSFFMPPPPVPQPKAPTNSATMSAIQQSSAVASEHSRPADGPIGSLSTSQAGSSPFGGFSLGKPSADVVTSSKTAPMLESQTSSYGGTTPTKFPQAKDKSSFSTPSSGSNMPVSQPTASGLPKLQSSSSTPSAPQATPSQIVPNPAAAPVVSQPKAPPTPRDLMQDFTKWFIMGDGGIMDQFEVFMIDNIAREAFDKFEKEDMEKKKKEDEERINEEVRTFRTYNLSLKYFYRWKNNAREKRLSYLLRSGRDQLRAFYASRYASQRTSQKEAEGRADKQRTVLADIDRPEEFMGLVRRRDMRRRGARDSLLSSGASSGMDNERETTIPTVQDEFTSRSKSVASSFGSHESSPTSVKQMSSKTKALREMYLEKPGRFRRSLPSISSRDSEPSENTKRNSNASYRWRLKAMGIVQLPDGTAVPESMATDMMTKPSNYSSLAFGSSFGTGSHRRVSSSLSDHTLGLSLSRRTNLPVANDVSTTNKRKRSMEEEEGSDANAEDAAGDDKFKRIIGESRKLRGELKALRQDLEEGIEWMKS